MLGSAMVRAMKDTGAFLLTPSRGDLDLSDIAAVDCWAEENRPDLVFHIAAKVGGIYANKILPADFMHDNLLTQLSVFRAARKARCRKLVFVATNCTYPVGAVQPITEDAFMTGPCEENIRPYAVSKIAGIQLCRSYNSQYGCDFVSIIPPNLYGPNDNYHPEHCHVVAGLIRRAHNAKISDSPLVVWGDGSARRELLHVDDLAFAMRIVMQSATKYDLLNIGFGTDHSISEIACAIQDAVGANVEVSYDHSMPNGSMGKLLDSSRVRNLGWKPRVGLEQGLKSAYQDFLSRQLS